MGVLSSAGVFLITSVAGFVLFALLLRLFMELSVVRVMHPVFDSIQKLTNPMIGLFKQSVFTATKTSTLVIALIVTIELVKCALVYILSYGGVPSIVTLLIMALFESVSLSLNLCFYAVLAHVLLSWVPSLQSHPIANLIRMVAGPILKPFYRLIPTHGSGFDFAPLLAILCIQLVSEVLLTPLVTSIL